MAERNREASPIRPRTAAALLRELGVVIGPRQEAKLMVWVESGHVTIQLNLESRGRPGWACFISTKKALTIIRRGVYGANPHALPELADIGRFPEWTKEVGARLRVKFDLAAARLVLGRYRKFEPELRRWLAPGAPPPPQERPSLLEWARLPVPSGRFATEMKAEAAWLQRVLAAEGKALKAAGRVAVAERIMNDSVLLLGPALRAETTGAMRETLRAALQAQRHAYYAPLFHLVLAEALASPAEVGDGALAEFHKVATSFSHLPGMIKSMSRFRSTLAVAPAARRVALAWSPRLARSRQPDTLRDWAVLVLLAVDGSPESAGAFSRLVSVQAQAAGKGGDEVFDLTSVSDRILAAAPPGFRRAAQA